jgi:DeoR family transcriptional regulator, deoxyribose operon repressor
VKRQSRLDSLQDIIVRANSTTIKDLAEQLNVSAMTIRRDMEVLESAGLVRTYRGGVIVAERHARTGGTSAYSLASAETAHADEKREIAKLAATLVEPGDVLFLDAGSTVELILDYVDPLLEMTVFCYSLNVLNLVAGRKNTRIVFAGGVYHADSQNFESPEGLQLLKRNRSSKAFISANGIRVDLGVTSSGQFEIPIKRAAIETSAKACLIADSSKCGLVRTGHFADIEDFNLLITDSGLPAEMRELFAERGVEVMTASI